MEEMIRDSINRIGSLDERVAFKELLEGVFLELYETNERSYRDLEERIMDDLSYDISNYQIKTGLIEKAYFDRSHHLLSAMREEDLSEAAVKGKNLRERFEEFQKVRIQSVFLECDYLELLSILNDQKDYLGIIRTDSQTYEVKVRLEPNQDYQNEIFNLYKIFVKNGITWQTINAPYLYKIMDVWALELPDTLSDTDRVREVRITIGDHNPVVRYDLIPVWNIRKLDLSSFGFPVPCEDHKNYEHMISLAEFGMENAYLVEEKPGMQSVRQQSGNLIVTGEFRSVQQWNIYMIRNSSDRRIDRYQYPLMENLRKDGFLERFQKRERQQVKTKAELKRFIQGFCMDDYLVYQDCGILEEDGSRPETYSMNAFIQDEIRDRFGRRRLVLSFQGKGENQYLNRDLASFIVSEVQFLYPEYHCEGKVL